MGRFTPSARRLVTAAGAALVGAAATVAFAAPASAWTLGVTGSAVCDTATGTWTVDWTVTNNERSAATLSDVAFTPASAGAAFSSDTIPSKGSVTAQQTGIPADAEYAKVQFKAVWPEDKNQPLFKKKVYFRGTCEKAPEPEPSASPSPSPSATPTPTPSETTTSPAPSETTTSPAPAPTTSTSAPTLPVTGAKSGIYAGVALALVGAGAIVFFMARRRRYSFTSPE